MLFDEHQAAAYLNLSLATIRRYHYGVGGRTGLRSIKIGNTVRYARADLDQFIEANARTPATAPASDLWAELSPYGKSRR